MSYRKRKKQFCRRFGFTIIIKFSNREGKILRKASKKASAKYMQRAIYTNKSWL